MKDNSDRNAVKKNSDVIITNKVILFWSQIIQISTICDIGKYMEVRTYKYEKWMIGLAGIVALLVSMKLLPLFGNYYLWIIVACFGPVVYLYVRYWWEHRNPKKFYFRIRMNGGQEHSIASDNESFIDWLIESTVAAMEHGEQALTFIGNIDNSTVIKNSNIAINSDIKKSFNKQERK